MVSKKILFLDDDETWHFLVTNRLVRNGYSVERFFSPEKALIWLIENKVDAIVSDFCMLEMNGFQFLDLVMQDIPKAIHSSAKQPSYSKYPWLMKKDGKNILDFLKVVFTKKVDLII